MEILDVNELVWCGEKNDVYTVSYKDKIYKKFSSHWSLIIDGESLGYDSVDTNYSIHLDKVWKENFGNKTITKEIKIIIE